MPSSAEPAPAHKHQLATEHEARAVAEAAREETWEKQSFARGLFDGRFDLHLIHPHPRPDPDEQARAAEFLAKLRAFVLERLDGDDVDRQGRMPREILDGLAQLGAFGIKIPREYGGLGLSQLSYARALEIVGSACASAGAWLSAHQSIGVPQPLSLFGTEEQKRKYLPRLARGAISAFALTEPAVGSDPANMSTTATPTQDGSAFILDGEKLWITNGPDADIMVVMARTPSREGEHGKRRITAFIVESDWPGVEVAQRCEFMGLRGISNGVIRFTNVRVPRENILWGEGLGLKLALITLNTGRLSLPAFCAAGGKGFVEMSRVWASQRFQWGQVIGKHDAIAQKLGAMAAKTFAMDAVVELCALMTDSGRFDIRLEAALAKMWNTEVAWELADDALQIRGGRGYETAHSLQARGEIPMPIERAMRDLRINLIFEGSSEIMRLFIAREAVDSHLQVAGDLVDPRAPAAARLKAAARAGLHYAWWYPSRWLGWGRAPRYAQFGPLARHVRYIDRTSRKLARAVFYSMIRYGAALEKRQAVLARIVEIGAELFAMSAACVRAQMLRDDDPSNRGPVTLADLFCRGARRRIRQRFDTLFRNDDAFTYRVARQILGGQHTWLEHGIIGLERLAREPEMAGAAEGAAVTTIPSAGNTPAARRPSPA